MGKKRRAIGLVAAMLRHAEIEMAEGRTLAEAVRQFGISGALNYPWGPVNRRRKGYNQLRDSSSWFQVDQGELYENPVQKDPSLLKEIVYLTIDKSIQHNASYRKKTAQITF